MKKKKKKKKVGHTNSLSRGCNFKAQVRNCRERSALRLSIVKGICVKYEVHVLREERNGANRVLWGNEEFPEPLV